VHAQDVLRDHPVALLVDVVCDDKEQVETREERVGQRDVAMRVLVDVVLREGEGKEATSATAEQGWR